MGGGINDMTLAMFSLEAHRHGVGLPGGTFRTVEKTLVAQWDKFIKSLTLSNDPLNVELQFKVEPEALVARVVCESRITTLRLKPLVEALNALQPGLGWWVFDVAARSDRDMFPMYSISGFETLLRTDMWLDSFSDQAVLDRMNECCEEEQTMEQLKDESSVLWPSDLIDSVDGHLWMLKVHDLPEEQRACAANQKPSLATLEEVSAFLNSRAPSELVAATKDFLMLHQELERSESQIKLGTREFSEESMYDMETMGASCVLVWDDHALPWDLIEHAEQREMECGEATTTAIQFTATGSTSEDMESFTSMIKDFVTRYAAIGRAFSHFEKVF